jgi:methionine-rich copper-binding protein CopC
MASRPSTPRRGRTARPAGLWARVLVLAGVAAMAAAVPVLAIASPAQAHNTVVSTTPAEGQTLSVLPEKFAITTNEALYDVGGEGAAFGFEVIDTAGLYYGDGCVSVVDATMSTPAAIGAPGVYTVKWQLVSADSHTVSGSYTFTWAPSDSSAQSQGHAEAQNCGRAPSGGSVSAGGSSPAPNADLGDVLWVGGAVVALGLAVGVTLFVVGRNKK